MDIFIIVWPFEKIFGNMIASMVTSLIILQVASENLNYADLQQLGGSCYPRDTCITLNSTDKDNLWGDRTCECGEHCIRHHTCCIDSPHVGENLSMLPTVTETCQKVLHTDISVLMVSNCSSKWRNVYIYEKCVHMGDDLRDPLSLVPVTNTISKTTYKNFFCAMCNNDIDGTAIWNIGIKKRPGKALSLGTEDGDILSRMMYDAKSNSWGILEDNTEPKKEKFLKVTLRFLIPSNIKKFVKKCYRRIVSGCIPLQRSKLEQKCRSYYAPIKLKMDGRSAPIKFRNVDCALCNNVTVGKGEDVCVLMVDVRKTGVSAMSFALLLDVNRNLGDKVGIDDRCSKGQKYDPFFKKCRSLTCGVPNYVLKNGACVKSEH